MVAHQSPELRVAGCYLLQKLILERLPYQRQYKGCIATRLEPKDYEFCNSHYDEQAHYEKYSALVP